MDWRVVCVKRGVAQFQMAALTLLKAIRIHRLQGRIAQVCRTTRILKDMRDNKKEGASFMKYLIGIYILFCFTPLPANAGADVDFDGRNTSNSNVTQASNANDEHSEPRLETVVKQQTKTGEWIAPHSVEPTTHTAPYAPYKVDPSLNIAHEICRNTGKCAEAFPENDWADQGYNRQEYTFGPGRFTRMTMRCARGDWRAQIRYSFHAYDEGHDHSDASFPPLTVSISTETGFPSQWQVAPSPFYLPEMRKGITYYLWTRLPTFAATIEKRFSARGGCRVVRNDSLHVRLLGLTPLPPADQWYFPTHHPSEIGYAHNENHYGTQGLIDVIRNIAKEYMEAFPSDDVLDIYDMSLPYGGIIDINQDWKRPFYGHATGIDADISKWRVPRKNRQKLLEIMCKHADIYSEQDVPGQPSYFHIRVASESDDSPLDNFGLAPVTTTKCCSGTSINPAVLDVCVSTQTVAHY